MTRKNGREGQETGRGREHCEGGTRSSGKEGQGEVLGKDTEQWEQVVRNSGTKLCDGGTRNSWRYGKGTDGMEGQGAV